MQHPFELKIADLQAIDFEIEDLTPRASAEVIGGTATIAANLEAGGGGGITADGVGPNEVGGPFTPPMGNGGGITADGVGPNEVGGPLMPSPLFFTKSVGEQGGGVLTRARCESGGGWATTLAVGEEGGGVGCPPRRPPWKPHR
jgi:hypothetical protein